MSGFDDYRRDALDDFEAAAYVEEEFEEYLRETAQEARDRIGDMGDLPEPLRWKIEVCAAGCQIHDHPRECVGPVQGAHLISQQALKKRGLEAHLWDRRNGIAVCEKAHMRNDAAIERFPAARIPAEAWEFAAWLGLTYLLERTYGKRELAA